MTQDLQISGVVVFVRDLEQSVRFYSDLLRLERFDSTTTAALLGMHNGPYLVLRAIGPESAHPLGQIGVQYVAWTLASKDDLDRSADVLRQRSAFRETRADANVVTVEGRDPDGLTVILVYADSPEAAMRELPARIYAW